MLHHAEHDYDGRVRKGHSLISVVLVTLSSMFRSHSGKESRTECL
jgi:hypothetical protein